MTNNDDKFTYYYHFDITAEHFAPAAQSSDISVWYRAGKQRIECKEKVQAFHRKLVFNILSKVPADKSEINFNAKYCYVLFESGGFVFCIDSVVSTNLDNRVTIPAQYLYSLNADSGTSPIKEYLENLRKVEAVVNPASTLFEEKNWPFASGFIDDNFKIEKKKKGIVRFSGTGTLNRYPLGEFAGFVPIPRFRAPMQIPTHGLVVGTLTKDRHRRHTEYVRTALEELTSILWGDGGLTTWIMGQPGSGKEVFAQALHHGAGRVQELEKWKATNDKKVTNDKDHDNFVSAVKHMKLEEGFAVQSVASVTLDEFNNRLFGVPEEGHGHCIIDVIDKLKGTIFLDEFDKPEKPFLLYSSLLRVLEAGQYIKRSSDPHDSNRVKETPAKFEDVNWIFAGAFTQVDPRTNVPFDLWSRLKGFIQLRNPLEDSKDQDYGSTLFLYWYFRLVAKILDKESVRPLLTAVSIQPSERDYREHVACVLLGQTEKLESPKTFWPTPDLHEFALQFQRLLNRKSTFNGDKLDSPRGIFKATEATFYFLRQKVFDGENFPLRAPLRDGALDEAHKALRLSRGPA